MKLIIFHSWLCEIGGCETVVYNLCQQLKDYYDILVVYTDGHQKQIDRLETIVDTEKWDKKKTYNCDIVLRNSSWGAEPDNLVASTGQYLQMIHSDYKRHLELGTFRYATWHKTTRHIACGDFVGKVFTETTGIECDSIKNIMSDKQPIEKIYKFIYAGRLTEDKGWNRIKKLADMLREEDIKFEIMVFSDTVVKNDYDEIWIRKPRYYDTHNELSRADYSLVLSDAEGLPMGVQESLQYGTPCIVTNSGGCMELIQHGVNGYVVPMNMDFDINIIKKIPKSKEYDNGTNYKTWCDYLGGSKYKVKKRTIKKIEPPKPIKITILKPFKDDNGKWIKVGDTDYTINEERKRQLVQFGLAKEEEI